ncbi:hypothetical protein CH63R_14573 [Colletotrichum higginsianum IMI 349063]|uniref:Uncharacterized protein n=1 Tax=Colletotrichum higginsianum (strain IMI 349063) TaxID=759273 RepID=A0A1B7XQH6_COLHI|nr:hypothetical protein CH63R_14573 [Colletotrichum higginsianum IMI 349063]OBR02001.1 hypothetical protein CH63R_14573 [Colletotrichum higginsianum IMI 349063]
MPRLPDMAGVIKQADQIVQDITEFLLGGGSSSSSLLVPQIPSGAKKALAAEKNKKSRGLLRAQASIEDQKSGFRINCAAAKLTEAEVAQVHSTIFEDMDSLGSLVDLLKAVRQNIGDAGLGVEGTATRAFRLPKDAKAMVVKLGRVAASL